MAKFLVQGSYLPAGVKGLMNEGGTGRRATVEKFIEGMGGSIEAFYYAFGDSDVYVIIEAPDNVGAAAASMAVNASGAVALKTTVLLSPEEMDAATKLSVQYQPPGA